MSAYFKWPLPLVPERNCCSYHILPKHSTWCIIIACNIVAAINRKCLKNPRWYTMRFTVTYINIDYRFITNYLNWRVHCGKTSAFRTTKSLCLLFAFYLCYLWMYGQNWGIILRIFLSGTLSLSFPCPLHHHTQAPQLPCNSCIFV